MSEQTRRSSPLSTVELITATNKSVPRNSRIRRLTPHCVAGNGTVEAVLNLPTFHDGKTASTSYAIGSDGRMGLGVEETNRPWTSSSSINDDKAITFEIANDGRGPDWHMSDEAINKFLDASVEICTFYGFSKVHYEEKPSTVGAFRDANGNTRDISIVKAEVEAWIATWANDSEMIITLHNWFSNKACPGPYFMRQLPWLVKEMNKRLSGSAPEAFIGEGFPTAGASDVLCLGSFGEKVKELQTRLNLHGANPELDADGQFGTLTNLAVRSFQTAKGLVVDGIVGAVTLAELNKAPSTVTPSENSGIPYLVRSKVPALNVRSGPGTDSRIVRVLLNDNNLYTIIEEADGPGASKWGKLKSGLGWISLDFVNKR